MATKRLLFDITELTVAERIQLVEDLWGSIVPETSEVALSPAQAAELDRRLEDLRRCPESGESWETVRARLQSCLRRQG